MKGGTRMDDFLKVKLDKMQEKKRNEVLDYLLKITKDTHDARRKDYRIESMADYTDKAKEIAENWGKFQGISSGYPSIDKLTKGFVPGEVTVVAAKTSVGKTALAVNIANKVALQGIPILFVTLEMTKAQLTSRFMYLNNDENYTKVEPLVSFQKTDELDWKSIDGLIGNFCSEYTNGLVVIDHLHYFTRELEKASEDLGRITKEFTKNAKRHEVPIILISHVRKASGKITLEDLRGSSYIGQDTDVILLCDRSDDGTMMGVKLAKNRNRGHDYTDDVIELIYDKTKITEIGHVDVPDFN